MTGKISAKSDNWFKSYGQKVSYLRLGTGIEYPEPEPGNRDLIPVEPGNKKSGYLTILVTAISKRLIVFENHFSQAK